MQSAVFSIILFLLLYFSLDGGDIVFTRLARRGLLWSEREKDVTKQQSREGGENSCQFNNQEAASEGEFYSVLLSEVSTQTALL